MLFSHMYGPSNEKENYAILDACRDLGVTHLDTANVYGMGKPEIAIGTYLKANPLARDEFIIATKATITRDADGNRIFDNSAEHLEAKLDNSLQRLGSAANHALRYFRAIYNHARRTYDLPECPAMAIEWNEDKPDGRIIDNLRDWRQAVDAMDNPIHRAFYELLLFTGLRKGEALTLEWKDIHEDRIHLPMTKNGRSFDLPILPVHHGILAPLKPLSQKWVFPSPKSATGHITGTRKLQWSPHAHRRTFATVAMEAGVLEEVVGRLLNHTPLSITGKRYTMPSLDALRPAMEAVSAELLKRQSG